MMKFLSDQPLSIFLSISGFFLFAFGDALKKWLVASYTVPETLTLTLFSAVFWILIFSRQLGGVKTVASVNRPLLHVLKTLVTMGTMYFAINGVKNLSLDAFYVIIFTAPLITTLLAGLIYKEDLTKTKLSLIFLGFGGVLLVANPFNGLDLNYMGVFYTLMLAVFFSLNSMLNKAFCRHDPRFPFVFLPYCAGALLFFGINDFSFPIVPIQDYLLALTVGFSGVIATLCLLKAFQIGNAASVANYHYTQLIWGCLLGYLLFTDEPTWMIVAGGGVIIFSGLALYFYDRSEVRKMALRRV